MAIDGRRPKREFLAVGQFLHNPLSEGSKREAIASTASTRIFRYGDCCHVRTIFNWHIAWDRGQVSRALLCVAVITILGAGIPLLAETDFRRSAAETASYEAVYYTALLRGHDSNAALRKAHFRTRLLMNELGMTRSEATALAVRSVIWGAGNLCGGG